MNSSITEGRDVNNYLYDVKLEKLDNIVNQIGSSISIGCGSSINVEWKSKWAKR